MEARWNLATCSYRSYRPLMGVPCPTSIGINRKLAGGHPVNSLKPYGVFRVLDHLPLDQRISAYRDHLERHRTDLEIRLDDLSRRYPKAPLVLLCWCHLPEPDIGPMGCHRRWAAEWLDDTFDAHVPELGPIPHPQPPPPTLF